MFNAGGPRPKRTPAGLLQRVHNVHTGFLFKLQRLFYSCGLAIGSRPILFLLTSLLISTISYGAIHLRFAQRLQDGFVSPDSLARVEQAIKTQFDGEEHIGVQRFVALIRRKDSGNLLNKDYLEQIKQVYDFINEHLTVDVANVSYRHLDLCGKYCDMNDLLWVFKECVDGVYANDDVMVDHPQSRYHEHSFLIAMHLFGITRKGSSAEILEDPDTINQGSHVFIPYNSENTWPVNNNRTALESATMVSIYFQAPIPDDNVTNILTQWETKIFDWSHTMKEFPDLKIDVMGDKILGMEMVRGGMSLLPYLIAGVTTTVLFVTAMVLCNASSERRKDIRLVIVVIGIIISPLLAVSSTFGLMGWLGVEIYPIHMVIPFLILAIGVDDAFLMSHAWERILPELKSFDEVKGSTVSAVVFARVLEEVGPSITITSLTNALAFAIGTTVSTPAMQLFCLSATIAITLDFIFEITLFGSLLVLSDYGSKRSVSATSKPPKSFGDSVISRYSRLLTLPTTRIVVLLGTFVFFLISLYGTISIETKIDSQKIIPYNSSLLAADLMLKDYYWKEYEPVQIFVNNPPDISNKTALRELHQMISEFESMPRSMGPKSTMLWLNDYEKVYSDLYSIYTLMGGDFPLSFDEVPHFLIETPAGAVWNRTIKWHRDENDKVIVDQFTFYTGIHNATTWVQRAENMLIWRDIAARWGHFNVTVFSENSAVFEGIFGLASTTALTAVLTLLSMIVVCVFFVPSFVGVITAALAIASISLGVLGFLSLSGLDLDPVTMSAIVMSIGFSVDYTAHISYHYQKSWSVLPRDATAADCVEYTISSVGWPMLEAAFSTLVCFMPVMLHPDYTPTVFVRTIVFVVLFGVIHGLVVLPTVLAMIPRSMFTFEGSRSSKQFMQHQPLPLVIETKPSCSSSLQDPIEPQTESARATPLPSDTSSAASSNETTVSLLAGSDSV